MPDNYFTELYSKDVSKHVEKKGKFSYLSWTYAVSEMCKVDESASWEVIRFDGLPYLKSNCGYFVEVAVTIKGFTKSQIHPVLDNNNKTLENPNAFQINTSIQRCLVKAIALHGLGLYIYSGEDLPEQKELTQEEIERDHQRNLMEFSNLIEGSSTIDELKQNWLKTPSDLKTKLTLIKDEVKTKLAEQSQDQEVAA
jgi:hypothetical protein